MMCLIVLAWKSHPHYPLIVLANRDEAYQRPTQALHLWESQPKVYAGKDLQAGGTWIGVSETGTWAAVTNYRQGGNPDPLKLSRGQLVLDGLLNPEPPETFLGHLLSQAHQYSPFNLLLGNRNSLFYVSNQTQAIQTLEPGIYGLSNALLDTPWPKVLVAKAAFAEVLNTLGPERPDLNSLFNLMQNTTRFSEADLPETGIGLENEKLLAPIFIQTPHYGTRSTSLLLRNLKGEIQIYERNYQPNTIITAGDYAFEMKTA